MGNMVSSLTLKLVDQVSGPAQKATKSLRQVDAAARGVKGGRIGATAAAGGFAARSGATLGAARGWLVAGGAAGLAMGARESVADFAALERKMTYVGLTAGATADATRSATLAVRKMAQMPGSPGLDKTVEGLESLVASGRSLPEAMAFLPAVTRTAVAANADITDMATTADALGSHFKITGKDMQGAFDTLVEGGKLGKFELKAMARYMPSLAPAAAAVGFKGAEGLKRFVAVLQTVRQGTGTVEEASASAMNIFSKMESEETAKRFQKFGINLRAEMAKARKSGKDLFETFIQLSAKALKGDMSKLPQLFQDMEFARGMRALLTGGDALRRFTAALANVDGSTMQDFSRIVGDTQDKIDQLSASMRELKQVAGGALAPAATEFVDYLSLQVREISGLLQDLDAWMKRHSGGSVDDTLRRFGLLPESLPDYRARVERGEAERQNPALRDVRVAQEEIARLSPAIAALEKAAEKMNPSRPRTTGELVVLNQLADGKKERAAAEERLRESWRRAGQAEFGPPGPVSRDDIEGIPATMGRVQDALNMKSQASAAGAAVMSSFADAINSQAAQALAAIDRFVAAAQGRLNFSVSPQISPVLTPPAGGAPAGGVGKQSLTGSDVRRIVRNEGDAQFRHSGLG